ncbi:unnamed protein product [Chondrus crispus]|uniref:Uncharacterized protein n=1 Tax=Chondrus crispus TaxID=2769 RepID=R7QJ45_CHOCR|nr:unnamed protein product [Chondrus crispus]CDF37471.1 unnamed protein product [Chondrus crispus]|eukprot:XP_005717290.1 unnamed protein product [Chondrus crispus]
MLPQYTFGEGYSNSIYLIGRLWTGILSLPVDRHNSSLVGIRPPLIDRLPNLGAPAFLLSPRRVTNTTT